MAMSRTINAEANNKAGMTLDELAAVVQTAMKAGAAGDEVVEITTLGWARPRIKTAKVTIGGEQHDQG